MDALSLTCTNMGVQKIADAIRYSSEITLTKLIYSADAGVNEQDDELSDQEITISPLGVTTEEAASSGNSVLNLYGSFQGNINSVKNVRTIGVYGEDANQQEFLFAYNSVASDDTPLYVFNAGSLSFTIGLSLIVSAAAGATIRITDPDIQAFENADENETGIVRIQNLANYLENGTPSNPSLHTFVTTTEDIASYRPSCSGIVYRSGNTRQVWRKERGVMVSYDNTGLKVMTFASPTDTILFHCTFSTADNPTGNLSHFMVVSPSTSGRDNDVDSLGRNLCSYKFEWLSSEPTTVAFAFEINGSIITEQSSSVVAQ